MVSEKHFLMMLVGLTAIIVVIAVAVRMKRLTEEGVAAEHRAMQFDVKRANVK